MKKYTLFLLAVVVLIVPMFAAVLPVHAYAMPLFSKSIVAPVNVDALGIILSIGVGFASLIGVAALVTALVSFGKASGIVKDGTSDQWAAGMNLLAFIGLVVFGVFRPDLSLQFIDGYAGRIAQVLMFILGFIVQITRSKPIYDAFKQAGIPMLGSTLSKG